MTYKRRDILEAVNVIAIFCDANLVVQHKGHLNDARYTDGHESVAESLVGHGTDHQLLRVGRHGPAREENDEAWDKVTLGRSIAGTAQPNTSQAGAPPDYTHGGVLPVVLDPGGTPAMLGEGIDAAPGGDDDRVEKLLRAASPFDPELTNKHEDGQQNAIGDEGTTHDEVSQTLAEMLPPGRSPGR